MFNRFCLNSINYANERLQLFFSKEVVESELQEYKNEGILLDPIHFKDNAECVNLIEGKLGIFDLIEEEGRVPNGTDHLLLEKLNEKFAQDSFYTKSLKKKLEFGVQHYAGMVSYSIDGFVQKNKDILQYSLASLLSSTSHSVLKEIFQSLNSSPEKVREAKKIGNSSLSQTISARNLKHLTSMHRKHKSNFNLDSLNQTFSSGRARKTRLNGNKCGVVSKFRGDVNYLITRLGSTMPSFVRCFKPNALKKANNFDSQLVYLQAKYSGILESVKVRASGFPCRVSNYHFLQRFGKFIAPEMMNSSRSIGDQGKEVDYLRSNAEQLLHLLSQKFPDLQNSLSNIHLGKSKVFLKETELKLLSEVVEKQSFCMIVNAQRIMRRAIALKNYVKLKQITQTILNPEDLENLSLNDIDAIESSILKLVTVHGEKYSLSIPIERKLVDKRSRLEFELAWIPRMENALQNRDTDELKSILFDLSNSEIIENKTSLKFRSLLEESKLLIDLVSEEETRRDSIRKMSSSSTEKNVSQKFIIHPLTPPSRLLSAKRRIRSKALNQYQDVPSENVFEFRTNAPLESGSNEDISFILTEEMASDRIESETKIRRYIMHLGKSTTGISEIQREKDKFVRQLDELKNRLELIEFAIKECDLILDESIKNSNITSSKSIDYTERSESKLSYPFATTDYLEKFNTIKGSFPLHFVPHLRTKEDFTKNCLRGRKKIQESMLIFSNGPLQTSLTETSRKDQILTAKSLYNGKSQFSFANYSGW